MKPRVRLVEVVQEDIASPDSVFIPESTLQTFLGVSGADLRSEAARLANENGWTAKPAPDGRWLLKRKYSRSILNVSSTPPFGG